MQINLEKRKKNSSCLDLIDSAVEEYKNSKPVDCMVHLYRNYHVSVNVRLIIIAIDSELKILWRTSKCFSNSEITDTLKYASKSREVEKNSSSVV